MKCRIAHFYHPSIPPDIDGVVKTKEAEGKHSPVFEIEIDDLTKFIEENGSVQVHPPGFGLMKDEWFIWVTDPDRSNFRQM